MTDLISELTGLLDDMIEHQRRRAHAAARRVEPSITPDDVVQPQDFPSVNGDPQFNYEDGQTAGLISARVAIVAHLRRSLGEGEKR